MRVLLRDQLDGTLFIMEIVTVGYNPPDNALFLIASSTGDLAIIPNISRAKADSIIRLLFVTGEADLSETPADMSHGPGPDVWDYRDVWDYPDVPMDAFRVPNTCPASSEPGKHVHVRLRPLR